MSTPESLNALFDSDATLPERPQTPGIVLAQSFMARAETDPYYVGPKTCGKEMMRLMSILSYCRGYESNVEKAFVKTHIIEHYSKPGLPHAYKVETMGPMQNVLVWCNFVATSGALPETLFSCHTDTVHPTKPVTDTQKIYWNPEDGTAFTDEKGTACLGADNGTGVWLLMQLLDAGVPGLYVFHRGEERGCIGSRWMKEHAVDVLNKFKRAVAFDRRDFGDIITHQRSSRTASDTFAQALSASLNAIGRANGYEFRFAPSSLGVYTDTANYYGIIPECTNVSIGYTGAHSPKETQDLLFAGCLAESLLKVDWEKLPTAREAKEETYDYNSNYHRRGYVDTGNWGKHKDLYRSADRHYSSFKLTKRERRALDRRDKQLTAVSELIFSPPETIDDFCDMTREERMLFARVLPEIYDEFVEQFIAIRDEYVQEMRAQERARTTSAPASTTLTLADMDDYSSLYGWE